MSDIEIQVNQWLKRGGFKKDVEFYYDRYCDKKPPTKEQKKLIKFLKEQGAEHFKNPWSIQGCIHRGIEYFE